MNSILPKSAKVSQHDSFQVTISLHVLLFKTPSPRHKRVRTHTHTHTTICGKLQILYTPYISRGFYFREFRESGASREFNNTRKYLPPIRTHECDLCTQY